MFKLDDYLLPEKGNYVESMMLSAAKLAASYLVARRVLARGPVSEAILTAAITPLGFHWISKTPDLLVDPDKFLVSGWCSVVAGIQAAALLRSVGHVQSLWRTSQRAAVSLGLLLVYSALDLICVKGLVGVYTAHGGACESRGIIGEDTVERLWGNVARNWDEALMMLLQIVGVVAGTQLMAKRVEPTSAALGAFATAVGVGVVYATAPKDK